MVVSGMDYWCIDVSVFSENAITPKEVGTAIFLAGIMMGLASLSDVKKMSKKEKSDLSNPKTRKYQFIALFAGVIVLILISALFLSLKFIFPAAEESFLNDFAKLGYDCLVMMLGFLCLIKQHIDRLEYVQSLTKVSSQKSPAK
jgi:hypothetical protein